MEEMKGMREVQAGQADGVLDRHRPDLFADWG
jgi:hypothetical protein